MDKLDKSPALCIRLRDDPDPEDPEDPEHPDCPHVWIWPMAAQDLG
jgi:hypothetical protein